MRLCKCEDSPGPSLPALEIFILIVLSSDYACAYWQTHQSLRCWRELVYVEWASRVKFVTIFGDLYQNKLWVIYNNLNQFAHLSSASGPSNDVIKMAAIVLLMYTYKISYLKQ